MKKIYLGVCLITFMMIATGCAWRQSSLEASLNQCQKTQKRIGNAGCLIVHEGRFLSVYNSREQAWDFPGGTSDGIEPAACTAMRETYEETGLKVKVGQKLHQYHNGYTLFMCHIDSSQIKPSYRVPIRSIFEVSKIRWKKANEIQSKDWRFESQWNQTSRVIHLQYEKLKK